MRSAGFSLLTAGALACGWFSAGPRPVELAVIESVWVPETSGPLVEVGRDALVVDDRTVLTLTEGALPASESAGLLIRPLLDSLQADTSVPRVQLAIDGVVPYGVVIATVYTTGQASAAELELIIHHPGGTAGALRLCPPEISATRWTASDWCMGGDGTGLIEGEDDGSRPQNHVVLGPDGSLTLVSRIGELHQIAPIDGAPDPSGFAQALDALRLTEPQSARLDVLADRTVPWSWVALILGTAQSGPDGGPRFPLVMLAAS